jgi:hypothetical protein
VEKVEVMCLLCDANEGYEKIVKAYQLSLWAGAFPKLHGKYQIARNYMTGVWPREFLLAHPHIIENHAGDEITDIKTFLDECDVRVAVHGSGDKAWLALNNEITKDIHTWAFFNDCLTPAEEVEIDHPEIVDQTPIDLKSVN